MQDLKAVTAGLVVEAKMVLVELQAHLDVLKQVTKKEKSSVRPTE